MATGLKETRMPQARTATPTGDAEGAAREMFRRTDSVGFERGLDALKRITRMSLSFRFEAAAAILCTILAAFSQLAIPVLLGRAVDTTQNILTSGGGTEALTGIAVVLLLMSVLRGLLTMGQNYFAESVGHRLARQIRLAVYDKIQRLPFSFHDRVHSGDLITVGMLDLEGVRMYFSTALIRLIHLVLLLGIGAGVMIAADPVLGLLALSFVPFAAWRSSIAHLTLRRTWLDLQERMAVLSRVMEENLAGMRVVRAFSARMHEMAKFDAASTDALKLAHRRVGLRVRNTSAMTLVFFASMGLVLWYGGRQVAAGEIAIGTLTAVLTFMTILQMPVRQLGMMVNSFARASTCGARIALLLDLAPEIADAPGVPELKVADGILRFEDVSFAYDLETSRAALHNVSFEARRGETIGIVGPPGSGKSTLAHLIPRFYEATGGRITIDGQDVTKVSLASLRREVAVVQQDSFLFTTTIENNIAYGEPAAEERRLRKAAESAQLHDYVLGLPGGYRTVVGERGGSLSGGQRQRLSIARTLLLRPTVMVFDDSTAAIDAGTEQRLRAAMQENADERITLIIAHRLNSLMHADRILFLEDGAIVEQGTHAELLALGGRYAALHALQGRPEEAA